ncbi:hypothetical protein OKW37_004236 [Paraburkholderia sp. MM5482-R2]
MRFVWKIIGTLMLLGSVLLNKLDYTGEPDMLTLQHRLVLGLLVVGIGLLVLGRKKRQAVQSR